MKYVLRVVNFAILFFELAQSVSTSSLSFDLSTGSDVLTWLQNQNAEVTSAQHSIRSFLHSKRIPVGSSPRSLQANNKTESKLKIQMSTDDNNYDCRITLGKATVGRKVVAPCGCTGSQEWVQFSEFNRMRRRDPSQWLFCQTCQQRFEYKQYQNYGGLSGNLISTVLDNKKIIRMAIGVISLGTLYLSAGLLSRLLTSRLLWQLYPRWSRITHLPLVLLFWGGKIGVYYLLGYYLEFEKYLMNYLTEIETLMIEPNLPITVTVD